MIGPGWLEPWLSRVAEGRTNVVTPVMDIIDDNTFEYKAFDLKSINIGGFDWNLQFTWISVPARENKRRQSDIDPIRWVCWRSAIFYLITSIYFFLLFAYYFENVYYMGG